ncbi:MAG: hypothetical protein ACI80K_002525 [Paracoccaceae bacterium]|jgi:hypothetical protein
MADAAYCVTTVPEPAGAMAVTLLAAVAAFAFVVATFLASGHTWFGRMVHSKNASAWDAGLIRHGLTAA